MVSANTKAILLLTAPLIIGRRSDSAQLLTVGEFNQLAHALVNNNREPADLLGSESDELINKIQTVVESSRLSSLLGRGFLLGQAINKWESRAIWVFSRADAEYPRRLKERLKDAAPVIIYGCGDNSFIENGGLAIVGSRNVDENIIKHTENVGSLAARAQIAVISGGANDIDRAGMFGGLQAGGQAVGILADSLERAALSGDTREFVMDSQLVLISLCDPAAGFDVGNAMQRNKIIYALADAALVVNSDLNKGGTWAGAAEQLEKFHFVPVYVRADEDVPGLHALQQKGALVWPDPQTPEQLAALLKAKPQPSSGKLPPKELQLSFLDQPEVVAETQNPDDEYTAES
jgi:predicted Rossmann fold nucleotide-binding protein DprA/Smf involved in DNA uptake